MKGLKRTLRLGRLKDVAVITMDVLRRLTGGRDYAATARSVDRLVATARRLYHLPHTRFRSAPRDLLRLGANAVSGRAIFEGALERIAHVFKAYVRVNEEGVEAVLPDIRLEAGAGERLESLRKEHGALVCVVPHCAGSILAASRFARTVPTRFLVREPKWERRGRIQLDFLRRLGLELVLVRRASRAARSRKILRALRDGNVLMATTDLPRPTAEKIAVPMFGTRVWLPAWPARFAARRSIPIVPCFACIRGGQVIAQVGEAILEPDAEAATAAWAAAFEREILASPADWVFMFDKQWMRVLDRAVRGTEVVPPENKLQPHRPRGR